VDVVLDVDVDVVLDLDLDVVVNAVVVAVVSVDDRRHYNRIKPSVQ
jgi:hypothetical protein